MTMLTAHDLSSHGASWYLILILVAVLVASEVIQINMVTSSFRYIASEVVASCLFESGFVITGIVAGAITLDEFRGMNAKGYVMFVSGTAINIASVILIVHDENMMSERLTDSNENSPNAIDLPETSSVI